MVQKIVKGKYIFARKAQPATEADKQVVTDLIDTLRANRETCVGIYEYPEDHYDRNGSQYDRRE